MIWTSATPSEFPSIRNFALKKKMALMAAHDSILQLELSKLATQTESDSSHRLKGTIWFIMSTKNIKTSQKDLLVSWP
jgi:hypothetical protein